MRIIRIAEDLEIIKAILKYMEGRGGSLHCPKTREMENHFLVMLCAHHYPEVLRSGVNVLDNLRKGSTNFLNAGAGKDFQMDIFAPVGLS